MGYNTPTLSQEHILSVLPSNPKIGRMLTNHFFGLCFLSSFIKDARNSEAQIPA